MREKLPLAKRARAQNIAMLCADFDAFLAEYAQAETMFGNVSDHFYHRALARRQEVGFEVLGSDVAASKLLHFISPNLLPPIDNRYTLQFVFGPSGRPSGYPPSELFRFVFATCVLIGGRAAPAIRQAVQNDPQRCPGHAKVIDNAIIVFVK